MDRLPLPLTLPFSPDLLWRYPALSGLSASQQPTSPLLDVKTHLPGALGRHSLVFFVGSLVGVFYGLFLSSVARWSPLPMRQRRSEKWNLIVDWLSSFPSGPDPRTWGREDVLTFLRWCEREFDLPGLEMDKFQMNGKRPLHF